MPEGFKAARAEGLTAKVKEQQRRGYYKRPSLRQAKSSWVELIRFLKAQELLPVVIFAFSKKVCEDCAYGLAHLDLTTSAAEKSEITVQFASALQRLQPNDRKLPQVLRVRELVRRGLGLHHASVFGDNRTTTPNASASSGVGITLACSFLIVLSFAVRD
jgi:antiviral helicase SKI2